MVQENTNAQNEAVSIPIKKGVLLTADEITEACKKMGGEDIVKIDFEKPLDTMDWFIIVTGSSSRHLKKMADMIVKAVS